MAALGTPQEAVISAPHLHRGAEEQLGERRKRLRIDACYPAHVRGTGTSGSAIRYEAVLDNLSSNGLYLRVRSEMCAGQSAFVVFHMVDVMEMPSKKGASAPTASIRAPHIAVRGTVLRAEPLENGLWGVVVVFKQYRFL